VVARNLFHGEDAGQPLKGFSFNFIDSLDKDGGLGIFSFGETVPELDDTLTPSVIDRAGNFWNSSSFDEPERPPSGRLVFSGPILTATNSGLSDDPDAGSAVTSTTNPRPMWVTPRASAGAPSERFVLARHTSDGGAGLEARSVWLSFQQPCDGGRCHQLLDAGVGAPSEPGPALSSVVADERAFLVTSSTSSPALASVTRGVPSLISVSNMPPLLGLSAVGNELWILSSTDAGAFFRQRVDELSDGGFALSQADVIVDGGYDGQAIDVFTSPDLSKVYAGLSLEGLPPKFDLFRSSPGAAGWVSFGTVSGLDEPVFSTRCTVLDGPSDQTPLCLASCGSRTGPRGLRLFYENDMGFTLESTDEDSEEIDVVRLGNTALGAWTTPGERRLGLGLIHVVLPPPSMPIPPSFQIVVEPGSRAVTSAYNPRLAVMNGEVLLTWSEKLGANGPWIIRAQVIH
jgi:hypothetical protein